MNKDEGAAPSEAQASRPLGGLLPLPPPKFVYRDVDHGWDAQQMREYAEAALLSRPQAGEGGPVAFVDRKQLAELQVSNGLSLWAEGPEMWSTGEPRPGVPNPPAHLVPLYAAAPSPQGVTLSDEQIFDVAAQYSLLGSGAHLLKFARALLAAASNGAKEDGRG